MIRFVLTIIGVLSCFTGCLICKDVHQSPSDVLCEPKESTELTCRHQISNYDTIFWYQRSYGDSSLKLIGYAQMKSLKKIEDLYKDRFSLSGDGEREVTLKILQTRPDQDSGEYFCAAYYSYAKVEFGEGTKLTVLAAKISKPNVKVLPPSPREICSQNKTNKTSTLVCVASDFYPDHVHVTWQVNGKDRNTNVATDITAQQDQSTLQYTITSRMKVDDADWMNPKNIFTCTVYFYNGMQTINVPHSIKGQKAHRVNPRSLNTFGFGYILFLSKSVLYALIMAGLVWKLKFSIDRKQLSED